MSIGPSRYEMIGGVCRTCGHDHGKGVLGGDGVDMPTRFANLPRVPPPRKPPPHGDPLMDAFRALPEPDLRGCLPDNMPYV